MGEPSGHGTALGVHLREVQVGAQVARLPLKEPVRGVWEGSVGLCTGAVGAPRSVVGQPEGTVPGPEPPLSALL